MKKALFTLPLVASLSVPVMAADDVDSLGSLVQPQFRDLSEDLAAALSYKAVAPAEPLGMTGIDIGVEVTNTSLENTEAYDLACGGCGADSLTIPKVHLHKGLPASIDVGVFLSSIPNSNIKLSGAELRYALMEGGVASPAIAVRGTYTRLSGVDQLDMDTTGLELTISKGFAMVTPYAGVGRNWVNSKPNADIDLEDEDFTQDKVYAGINLNMGLLNIAVEGDQTGDTGSYSAKLGFRF
ncbi:MAG: hypothetical protein R6X15_04440 [Pseudomonadota bacterium]